MLEAYDYKQQIISNLDSIDNNTHNFYNYKGLNFLSKLNYKNKNLVIIFHGAIGEKSYSAKKKICFRGYDWEINNTNIICISDYLLNKYDNYEVNWTLSTKKYNVEYIYVELFTHLINKQKYNKVVFTGTSAGGFPSLKFACKFNCIALISNSQIYLENHENGFKKLKNSVIKDNDTLLYKNNEIENIIDKCKPKLAIIYNNKKDKGFKLHIQPFIKYIKNNKISNLFQINIFDYNGIIQNKTHHHIMFPNNKTHLEILQEFVK